MFLKMETQNKRTRNNNSLVRIPRLRHGPDVLSNDLILYVILSIELLFSCSIDIVLMFPFVSKYWFSHAATLVSECWPKSLQCSCCAGIRASGKQAKCHRASRRLREARLFIESVLKWISETLRLVSIADCEDSIDMMRWVSFTLACSKADISEKFNWLSCVPWLFVEADKQEQALEILAQIDSKQESEHDPLTITLGNRHREDLVGSCYGRRLLGFASRRCGRIR